MNDFQKMLQSLTAVDLTFLPLAKPAPQVLRSDPASQDPLRQDQTGSDQTGTATVKKTRKRRGGKLSIEPTASPLPDAATSTEAGEPTDDSGENHTVENDHPPRQRNCPSHKWPEIGATLTATYYGVTYEAEVIAAGKRLKSGRQIRLVNSPARGQTFDSLSRAMLAATGHQRKTANLGRKGVASGWEFWTWKGKSRPKSTSNA